MLDTLNKLRGLFGIKERRKFLIIFVMMIFAALFETLGIGLIAPFVGFITKPQMINESKQLMYIYDFFGFQSNYSFLIALTLALLFVFVLKNIYLIIFNYIKYRIIYREQVHLSKRLFTAYLAKPYTFHLQRNSADLVRNTNTEVQKLFQQVITPFFLMLTELTVLMAIISLLLVMAPFTTLLSGVVLTSSITLFLRVFRKRMAKAGNNQQIAQGGMIKSVNQGLGAGKELMVSGRLKYFIDAYNVQSQNYAKAAQFHAVIKEVPRMFIETILVGTILMVILVIVIQSQNLTELLQTVSLFAMAAFRLIPSLNRIMVAMATLRHNKPALDVIYHDLIVVKVEKGLDLSALKKTKLVAEKNKKVFKKSIDVKNVSFSYPGMKEKALCNISLTIPIGTSVAFVGPSGSGKTTMVDTILGVLSPSKGTITIDGEEIYHIQEKWKENIGYIPQFIYLSDDSIRNNVAFGLEKSEITDEQVWKALEKAHLKEFVEGLPEQLDTFVGERGVRLSGGQRQRIGIARALYHDPEILFLDEATSALDNYTEGEIMKAIDALHGEKTIIIIAHRLSTIQNCDIVFTLKNGKLASIDNRKLSRGISEYKSVELSTNN